MNINGVEFVPTLATRDHPGERLKFDCPNDGDKVTTTTMWGSITWIGRQGQWHLLTETLAGGKADK